MLCVCLGVIRIVFETWRFAQPIGTDNTPLPLIDCASAEIY